MIHDPAAFGKKVFFLNPPSVIGEVLAALSDAEFEVYTASDHLKLARYLRVNPTCIVFVNIDAGTDELAWRKWISTLKESPTCKTLRFGVVSMQSDDERRNAYLMGMGVECGFVILKQTTARTTEILLKTLEANEARGRRKFVRAHCPEGSAEFNCKGDLSILRGPIMDISSAGMMVTFAEGAAPPPGAKLKDMQLSLKSGRVILDGVVLGKQEDTGESNRLIMFAPSSLDTEKRLKLRTFIRKSLQASIDQALIYV